MSYTQSNIKVEIGEHEIEDETDMFQVEHFDGLTEKISTCNIEQNNQFGLWDGITVTKGDLFKLYFKYSHEEDWKQIFDGYVLYVHKDESVLRLICVDRTHQLTVRDNLSTFSNSKPEDILNDLLNSKEYDFESVNIDETEEDVEMAFLSLRDESFIDAVNMIERKLQLEYRLYCDATGNLYYKPKPTELGDIKYKYIYGDNVISADYLHEELLKMYVFEVDISLYDFVSYENEFEEKKNYLVVGVVASCGVNEEDTRCILYLEELTDD